MGTSSHFGRCLILAAAVLAGFAGCGVEEESLVPADPELATSQLPLTQVTNFGSNPGSLKMYMHVPAGVPQNAGLVVWLHGCAMSGPDGDKAGWNQVADAWKFYVIYPDKAGGCFAWFDALKTKRGAGEVASVKSMVDYAKSQYSIDPERVFVTGLSAGGGLASALLAGYPDVFSAGALFAGLPAGCAMGCMSGTNKTPQAWGDAVRSAFPGYSGAYPRVQIWQGSSDTVVSTSNQQELMEQWTNVNGIDQIADETTTVSGATRKVYRNAFGQTEVETWSIPGMGHGTPVDPTFSTTNGCGTTAMFSLDVGLCSSYHAGMFFGLGPGGAIDGGNPDPVTPDGDAGQDAGVADGGGTRTDAGSPIDGGNGTGSDAGSQTNGGTGSGSDAGVQPSGNGLPSGGKPGGDGLSAAGVSCAASGTSAALPMFLLVLLAFAVPRGAIRQVE